MKTLTKQKQTSYQCGVCKFVYKEKRWAQKCQDWCDTHPTCNDKITTHAAERG